MTSHCEGMPSSPKGQVECLVGQLGNRTENQMALVAHEALPPFLNDLQNEVINHSPFVHCANDGRVHYKFDIKHQLVDLQLQRLCQLTI